jgi:r-opsin
MIIISCYYFIVRAVFHHEDELRQQAKKMNVTSLRSNSDQQAVSAEIRIAKVACINVTLWVLAWTPFTVVCMLGTWGDTSKITPLICELPVILAKTSCVYNPIIYALSHPKYREVKVALTEINQRNFIYFFYLFHVQCLKELYPWLCIVVETKKSGRHGGDDQSTNSTKTEASGTTQG